MNQKKEITASVYIALLVVTLVIGSGVIINKITKKNPEPKVGLKSEHVGTIEGCDVYRVKATRLPPQLLWKCK